MHQIYSRSRARSLSACFFGAAFVHGEVGLPRMPKWIVYCRQCNRPSAYQDIDPEIPAVTALLASASPSVKKPLLPEDGNRWECPFCKKSSHIKECDLTFSYS
jgi:hypothetical protein